MLDPCNYLLNIYGDDVSKHLPDFEAHQKPNRSHILYISNLVHKCPCFKQHKAKSMSLWSGKVTSPVKAFKLFDICQGIVLSFVRGIFIPTCSFYFPNPIVLSIRVSVEEVWDWNAKETRYMEMNGPGELNACKADIYEIKSRFVNDKPPFYYINFRYSFYHELFWSGTSVVYKSINCSIQTVLLLSYCVWQ